MKMVSKLFALCLLVLFVTTNVFATESIDTKLLYQVSTLQSLLAGEYDGAVSLEYLTNKGSMGLGTFDKLDGEMIVWDGVVYQGKVDGKVYVVDSKVTVPFANVANIETQKTVDATFIGGYDELKKELNRIYPKANKPVLFCISGSFKNLSYRSVPAQEKPYPPLTEVVKDQVVFEKDSIDGFLVGFRFPTYMKGINISGFHLHFLSKDKSLGGHLFAVDSGEITIKASTLNTFEMFLPDTIETAEIDKVDSEKAVEAVEKLHK